MLNLTPATNFMVDCSSTLPFSLCIIYPQSLNLRKFSSGSKYAIATPLHIGSDRFDIKNYGQKSHLNCIAKLFESIIEENIAFRTIITLHQKILLLGKSCLTNSDILDV